MTERPLPHNRNAEVSVLGGILLDNKYLTPARAKLKPHDFLLTPDRTIFREMLAMADANIPVDPISLADELRKKSHLDQVGGVAYIEGLIDGVPRTINIEHHAKIIAENSLHRQIAHMAMSFHNSALEGEKSPESLLHELESMLREISLPHANGNGNGNGHFAYLLPEFMETKLDRKST